MSPNRHSSDDPLKTSRDIGSSAILPTQSSQISSKRHKNSIWLRSETLDNNPRQDDHSHNPTKKRKNLELQTPIVRVPNLLRSTHNHPKKKHVSDSTSSSPGLEPSRLDNSASARSSSKTLHKSKSIDTSARNPLNDGHFKQNLNQSNLKNRRPSSTSSNHSPNSCQSDPQDRPFAHASLNIGNSQPSPLGKAAKLPIAIQTLSPRPLTHQTNNTAQVSHFNQNGRRTYEPDLVISAIITTINDHQNPLSSKYLRRYIQRSKLHDAQKRAITDFLAEPIAYIANPNNELAQLKNKHSVGDIMGFEVKRKKSGSIFLWIELEDPKQPKHWVTWHDASKRPELVLLTISHDDDGEISESDASDYSNLDGNPQGSTDSGSSNTPANYKVKIKQLETALGSLRTLLRGALEVNVQESANRFDFEERQKELAKDYESQLEKEKLIIEDWKRRFREKDVELTGRGMLLMNCETEISELKQRIKTLEGLLKESAHPAKQHYAMFSERLKQDLAQAQAELTLSQKSVRRLERQATLQAKKNDELVQSFANQNKKLNRDLDSMRHKNSELMAEVLRLTVGNRQKVATGREQSLEDDPFLLLIKKGDQKVEATPQAVAPTPQSSQPDIAHSFLVPSSTLDFSQ
ncbi:hypothetical protein O181_080585, partial [Austropuccinia psidii MF-1]|nr:hypothetical protein [Austropuccinia psidii MF-1]